MSLEDKYPDIAKEFDISKNNITADKIHSGTPKKFWWLCDKNHSWIASVSNRTSQKTGCPYCKGKLATKENNLLSKYPDIAKEWDYNKMNKKPYDFLPSSNKRVSWVCKFGHKWDSSITYKSRIVKDCCPFCSSQKVNKTNSLYHTHKNTHKNIIKYIAKDNTIDPKSITYGTSKKLKFILNSKEYYTTPRNFNRYIS